MRAFIFSDEAGCFTFERNDRASRYFMVCTIAVPDCSVGDGLLQLRRELVWRRLPVGEEFHATEDVQAVRDEVYRYISGLDFRVDVTLLEKSKAQPQTRESKEQFYKTAWYFHFKHVGPQLLREKTEAYICAASIGTKKGQAVYTSAVNDVLQQVVQRQQWATFFPRAIAEPCLQIADYCAWAIQRKWERGDDRAYQLISNKVISEYDLWRNGQTHYY